MHKLFLKTIKSTQSNSRVVASIGTLGFIGYTQYDSQKKRLGYNMPLKRMAYTEGNDDIPIDTLVCWGILAGAGVYYYMNG